MRTEDQGDRINPAEIMTGPGGGTGGGGTPVPPQLQPSVRVQREKLLKRIENDFRYHPPAGDDDVAAYTQIRGAGRAYAKLLVNTVPPGRELSLALTHLEQAVMWANAGRARGGGET